MKAAQANSPRKDISKIGRVNANNGSPPGVIPATESPAGVGMEEWTESPPAEHNSS
ncbi:hypothetical protein ANO14919_122780 [Xylariales sp. No.14919]|nr:hypothetical protein ANO14919_122780 [Xylariales sp. No.14919]